MVNNLTKKLNDFLNNEKLSKENFDELKYVANLTNFDEKILIWFKYLQEYEITGWRNKLVTKKICNVLQNNEPIQFYSLFCPSYLKGEGAVGFRTDDVGNTTKNGLDKLKEITDYTKKIGFECIEPTAIFFDIALEQPEKTIYLLEDLKKNINNFKKYLHKNMKFEILSEKFPELFEIVGYGGIILDPLPVKEEILERIIERGGKFYQLFGWDKEQIIQRSKVIASSEATVGTFLRINMKNAIMVYTPTMLERAQVYSGKQQNNPLAIIVPKK